MADEVDIANDYCDYQMEALLALSARITNEVTGVGRAVYDVEQDERRGIYHQSRLLLRLACRRFAYGLTAVDVARDQRVVAVLIAGIEAPKQQRRAVPYEHEMRLGDQGESIHTPPPLCIARR